MSTTKLAIIILTAVFLMGVPWYPATLTSLPAHQSEATFSTTLTGYAYASGIYPAGWINPSGVANPPITVTQGDTVSLTLVSGDSMPHQFYVDVDKNGVPDCSTVDPCSKQIPPMTTFTFTVNFVPSTYTYYCLFHQFSMFGTFTVLAPSAPATFVHGKLSWTHHLSLTKNGLQTFTAHVLDTGSSSTTAIVHLTGISSAFSAESSPMVLQPGIVTDIIFTSNVASFQNTKVCFTATLTFGPTTGQENTSPLTKTGCFAVVP